MSNLLAAGGWITALDGDFTTAGSQTLTTDGSYTIFGKTWTKFNSTNDSTAMAIDGTGLVIIPKSTGDYTNSTRTFPGIYLPLSSIIPNFDPSMEVRLWGYVASYNGAANFDNAVMGIDTQSAVQGAVMKRGVGTTGSGTQAFLNFSSTSTSAVTDLYTPGSTNNAIMMHLPCLTGPIFRCYRGTFSSGFPAVSAMTPHQTNNTTGTSNTSAATLANYSLFLGGQRAGSATALTVKWGRVRLDYKR